MSNEVEYDPFEYAEELAAGEDLGRSDLRGPTEGRRGGLTRRELIAKRGAVGAPQWSAAWARSQARPRRPRGRRRERQVHRHAAGAQLGVEFPIPDIAKQASRDLGFTVKPVLAPSEKQPQIAITSAGHVRRLRRLQLPVAAGLALRRAPAGRHAQDQGLESSSTSCSPTASSTLRRRGARSATGTRRSARRSSTRTGRRACRRSRAARRTTSRSSAGSARTASRSAGSRSPASSSAPRRTSTPTRWATTPT